MEGENTAPGRERRRPVAPPIGGPGRVGRPGRGQRQRVQDGRGRGPGWLRAALPGAGGPGDGGADRDPNGLGGRGAAPLLRRGGGGRPIGDVVVDAEVPELDVDAANVDVAQLPLARELGRRREEVPPSPRAAPGSGLDARGGRPRGGRRRGGRRGGRGDGRAVERRLGALPPRRHRHGRGWGVEEVRRRGRNPSRRARRVNGIGGGDARAARGAGGRRRRRPGPRRRPPPFWVGARGVDAFFLFIFFIAFLSFCLGGGRWFRGYR